MFVWCVCEREILKEMSELILPEEGNVRFNLFTSKAVTQIKHQIKHTKPADCMSRSNYIASPHSRGSDYGYLS